MKTKVEEFNKIIEKIQRLRPEGLPKRKYSAWSGLEPLFLSCEVCGEQINTNFLGSYVQCPYCGRYVGSPRPKNPFYIREPKKPEEYYHQDCFDKEASCCKLCATFISEAIKEYKCEYCGTIIRWIDTVNGRCPNCHAPIKKA
jgi:DNA-directed RNA polymerase subunit RPC12/RpoP